MTTSMGRLIIALEGSIAELAITNENEKDEYLSYLSSYLPEGLRQNLLTWRGNWHDNECAKQKHIANSITPTPDHIQREQNRAKAKAGRA